MIDLNEEVEALIVGLSRAVRELRSKRPPQCQEGAVSYRFNTAISILDIMLNDAQEMKRLWKEQEE